MNPIFERWSPICHPTLDLAHGRANHSLVRLESRPPARDDREDRASRSSAVIFCCAHPPRLARLARGIRARLKFGIRRALFLLRRCSFTMDKARLLYRCAPARLPLRSAPAKVGFSHRASSCARGRFDFISMLLVDRASQRGWSWWVCGRSEPQAAGAAVRSAVTDSLSRVERANMCAKSPAPAGRQPARRERVLELRGVA